jgi:hypothetical protein
MRRGKNHGHQSVTISLSQEFWVTCLWRLTRESSLHETLARVYVPYHGGSPPHPPCVHGLRPILRLLRASASLRQKPRLYPGVNLEQLQHKLYYILFIHEEIHIEGKRDFKSLAAQNLHSQFYDWHLEIRGCFLVLI